MDRISYSSRPYLRGGGSAPPKKFLIFLKNEGKEVIVEKMKRDGWGVNC